jgi:hypothetical protein
MHLKTLSFALLSLISAGQAHESSQYRYVPNDLQCKEGFLPTFVHNSYTYIAPLHKFTNITGSFFNIAWEVVIAHI